MGDLPGLRRQSVWASVHAMTAKTDFTDDEWTRLPLVGRRPRALPPEPFRRIGGTLFRAATLACEDAYEAGRAPPRSARAIAAVPRLLGLPLGTR